MFCGITKPELARTARGRVLFLGEAGSGKREVGGGTPRSFHNQVYDQA